MSVVRRARGCSSRVGVSVCGRSVAGVRVTCIAACVAVARSSKAVMVVVLLKCRRGSVDCNDAAVLESLSECHIEYSFLVSSGFVSLIETQVK